MRMQFNDTIDWLNYIIDTDIKDIDKDSINGLDLDVQIRKPSPIEGDELIYKVYNKFNETDIEEEIWVETLNCYPKSLPDEICYYLIDNCNRIVILHLGHTEQSDAVMWKLGHFVDEAALTLGKKIYKDNSYSLKDFKRLLTEFYCNHWLWWSLIREPTNEVEKKEFFEEHLNKRLDRDIIINMFKK